MDENMSMGARVKPRFRGELHRYAFFASLLPGLLLVLSAPTHRAATVAGLYAASLAALLGTSALYHCIHWSPRARFWMARLDLAMIFVLIAGTYTPIVVLALQPPLSTIALTGMWLLAAAGSVLKVFWVDASKAASSCLYVAVGSIAVVFMPQITASIGAAATSLLVIGGLLYIAGAVVYGLQRPDPLPEVFGYHEIFHGFVVAGAAVHFAAVALYVIPAG
ncbi:MAG: hemolysin III family protein [Candidatus Binatia bacterium]